MDKIKTWIPEKLLFPPFEFLSLVNYPAFCKDVRYHTHDMFQELIVISGQFDLGDPQGNRMSVKAGEILIIPPEKPHAWNIGATGCTALQIIHVPMFLENYGDLSILFGNVKADWQKVKIGREAVNNILNHLKSELKDVRPADSVLIFAYLLECFTMALRSYSRGKCIALKGIPGELAIKAGVTPRKLDAGVLRKQLIKQGISLDKKPSLYVAGFRRESPLPEKPKYEIGASDNLAVRT